MRAIQLTEFGGPETLVVRDVPDPQPAERQVVLDVLAAGVNDADTHQTEDSYLAKQALPLIPGSEVVVRDGSGRRLPGLIGSGGYAQRVAAAVTDLMQLIADRCHHARRRRDLPARARRGRAPGAAGPLVGRQARPRPAGVTGWTRRARPARRAGRPRASTRRRRRTGSAGR